MPSLPAGVPTHVHPDATPIQPIMINVPAPAERGLDIWHLIAAIVVAVVISGVLSVTISISFRNETLNKIDKVEQGADRNVQQIRALDTKITRIEARQENDR